jgi:5-methylcytosine-specific restriction endonuclease McrA
MEGQSSGAPQWLLDMLARQHDQMVASSEHQAAQMTVLAKQLEESNQRLLALANQQNAYEAAATQSRTHNPTPTTTSPTPDALSYSSPSLDPLRRPKPSFPDPDPYDHTDKTLYPQFIGLLQAKIKHDGLSIGGEEKQAWYMFGRLKGNAAKRIFPWVNVADQDKTLRTKDLFDQMNIAFLDPRAKEKALAALNCTKQGKLSINDFLGEFDQLLLEAGGWNWADSIRKGYLKDALSTEILTALVGTEEKPTYEAYCQQLRRVADQLDEVQEKSLSRPYKQWRQKGRREGTQPVENHDPMDWEAAIAAAVRVAVAGRTGTGERWASEKEVNRRRQEGLCLRCGKDGHFVRDCRTKLNKPQQENKKPRVAAAKVKGVKGTWSREEERDGDEESSLSLDESSGKE